MAKPAPQQRASLYDQDFHAWLEEQGRLLKARSAAALDWGNLAEEIESLGRSDRGEISSRLAVVLQNLLQWEFQPSKRRATWAASLLEARDQISRRLQESPSLRAYPETVLEKQYKIARLRATDETNLPRQTFPPQCPYSLPDILDEDFFPGAP